MPISPCIKPSKQGGTDTSFVKRPEDAILITEDVPNIEADELKVKEIIYNCQKNAENSF
jgi:hypothetical protein